MRLKVNAEVVNASTFNRVINPIYRHYKYSKYFIIDKIFSNFVINKYIKYDI